MTDIESFVVETARGLYRDEMEYPERERHSRGYTFYSGQDVLIDPFCSDEDVLRGIYVTFLEYETDDIARVRIRPNSENRRTSTWFDEPAGEYYIHERYLIPR